MISTMFDLKEYSIAQVEEIRKYRWIESERAGRDLGEQCCLEWVKKYAKDFREYWDRTHLCENYVKIYFWLDEL